MAILNEHVAQRLDEVALILEEQGANPFRVRAYRRGAATLRALPRPVADVFEEGGLPALEHGAEEGQWTVVTAHGGPLDGRRVVRGREGECAAHYGVARVPAGTSAI